jgi:lipopolysaccharide transport system permease protein
LKDYARKLYETRYFWLHLAQADLKSRFRRSKLGILWSMANPLFLTILMAVIFGTIFDSPLNEYAPYILSGLVVWDVIVASFVGGSNASIFSEQYVRQVNHPLTIYSLKWALVTIANFLIAIISLTIWMLCVSPANVFFELLTLPLTIIVFLALSWSITTFSAMIGTKYRDYPQIIALIMQAAWYLSPVFFKREMFLNNFMLEKLFYFNPIAHILELIRAPFLYGKLPTLENYLFSVGFVLFWFGIAFLTHRCYKNTIIFYI